jgi:heme exporter protein D
MRLADFFAMGGYGFYIWGSYGLAVVLIIAEVILVRRRRRTILGRLGRMSGIAVGENDETQA